MSVLAKGGAGRLRTLLPSQVPYPPAQAKRLVIRVTALKSYWITPSRLVLQVSSPAASCLRNNMAITVSTSVKKGEEDIWKGSAGWSRFTKLAWLPLVHKAS